METIRINIEYVRLPIPDRDFDYCATYEGYEPGNPLGYGATAEEAAEDLAFTARVYEEFFGQIEEH